MEMVSDNEEVVNALKEGGSSPVASAILDDCYYMSYDFNDVLFDSVMEIVIRWPMNCQVG